MIRNSLTVLLSLFVAQFAIAIPVQSAPYPYVASWRQKYSMSQCVNDAYTIARKHQFTDDQQLTNESIGRKLCMEVTKLVSIRLQFFAAGTTT